MVSSGFIFTILSLLCSKWVSGYRLPTPCRRLKSVKLSSMDVTTTLDRLESVKAAVISTASGSICFLPYALLTGIIGGFDGQWEFSHDSLAIMLALFGITYRYIVRENENPMLTQGAVGAFAITRALSLINVPDTCSAIPLDCGAPFHYFSFSMALSGLSGFVESIIAFGGAAFYIERAFNSGILKKFPSAPTEI
eukprot:gene9608-19973_t